MKRSYVAVYYSNDTEVRKKREDLWRRHYADSTLVRQKKDHGWDWNPCIQQSVIRIHLLSKLRQSFNAGEPLDFEICLVA